MSDELAQCRLYRADCLEGRRFIGDDIAEAVAEGWYDTPNGPSGGPEPGGAIQPPGEGPGAGDTSSGPAMPTTDRPDDPGEE